MLGHQAAVPALVPRVLLRRKICTPGSLLMQNQTITTRKCVSLHTSSNSSTQRFSTHTIQTGSLSIMQSFPAVAEERSYIILGYLKLRLFVLLFTWSSLVITSYLWLLLQGILLKLKSSKRCIPGHNYMINSWFWKMNYAFHFTPF